MTIKQNLCTLAALGMMALAQVASANSITGDISFDGTATLNGVLNGGSTTATKFTAISAEVSGGLSAPDGDYTGLAGTTANFTAFTFNPNPGSVTPLWTFTVGGTTYSFAATTMSVTVIGKTLDIQGDGIASITGFTDTAGSYTITVGQSGSKFSFGSTATVAPAPDGGLTVAMLGGGLVLLGGLRRKLK